jgi:phosphoglycerate kinase
MADDCIGPEVETAVGALKGGDILLLENLRFHTEEEEGDERFAKALAGLGDVYVNDAFGTSHRAHASMAGITRYLPAVAGFLLEKEINTLGGLLENPETPFIAIFGGAKVSDKVAILENIMDKVEAFIIGGAMSATFLRAKSYRTGKSLVEEESIDIALELLEQADKSGVRILLPVDVVVAAEINKEARGEVVSADSVPEDKMIVDIGTETVGLYCDELKKARTIFWNGPMGIEEIPRFASGTNDIARYIAGLDATTIIGGGSTAEVIYSLGLDDRITFISTGGGASLEFLGGEELPGVVLLKDK